jgi:hypothetical protein
LAGCQQGNTISALTHHHFLNCSVVHTTRTGPPIMQARVTVVNVTGAEKSTCKVRSNPLCMNNTSNSLTHAYSTSAQQVQRLGRQRRQPTYKRACTLATAYGHTGQACWHSDCLQAQTHKLHTKLCIQGEATQSWAMFAPRASGRTVHTLHPCGAGRQAGTTQHTVLVQAGQHAHNLAATLADTAKCGQ